MNEKMWSQQYIRYVCVQFYTHKQLGRDHKVMSAYLKQLISDPNY